MSDKKDGDRGALLALGLALIAIVFIVFIQIVPERLAGSAEFNVWRERVPQWIIAVFSGLGTFVSIWAVWLVRSTLKETRISTKAAQDAVIVTREVGVAQTRAWIIPDGFESFVTDKATINGKVSNDALIVIAKWRNAGNTPAQHLDCFSVCDVVPYDAEIPVFPPPPKIYDEKFGVIGPNFVFKAPMKALDGATRARNKEIKFILYSRVEYSDLFEPNVVRVSEICVQIEFNGYVIVNGETRDNIEHQPVGRQNSIS